MAKDTTPGRRPEAISERFIRTVCQRIAGNKKVRRNLPISGRIHVDRQLPFLCVYRHPATSSDEGTQRLVTTEAAYLIASGSRRLHSGLTQLVQEVSRILAGEFGTFLILELWSGELDVPPEGSGSPVLQPQFRILVPRGGEPEAVADAFEEPLSQVKLRKCAATVEVVPSGRVQPPGLLPIAPYDVLRELGCHLLGLEVGPVYRNPATGELYPVLLRDFRRALSRALRRGFYRYSRAYTTARPAHFHVLGRRAVVKAVWEADRRLAEVADRFDFLLQVTPVNAEQAWRRFRKERYERQPVFRYRLLPMEPATLKRQLFQTPIERVEDPALAHLLREKQDELDRRITLLHDINTPRFVHGSIQLYGGVEDELLELAEQLLDRLPPRTRSDSRSGYLDAAAFAQRAQAEIDAYRRQYPEIAARVELRGDIVSGLMVSKGSLLVSEHARFPVARAEALLQHEVGTHVLTYYNGRAQRLRQLYSGLAGYEALQEGLAVLAEHLVGGLSKARLRLLAARVVAVRRMLEGASFVDTFRELDRTYDFERRTAFWAAMRVYRGGGLTKDAVYLRGLCEVLRYLGSGGELEPLWVGKIATEHIPIIRELRWRQVLCEPPLRPRYMEMPSTEARLARLRQGVTVLALAEGKSGPRAGSARD